MLLYHCENLRETPLNLEHALVLLSAKAHVQLRNAGYDWILGSAKHVVNVDRENPELAKFGPLESVIVIGSGHTIDRVKMIVSALPTMHLRFVCIPTALSTNAPFHGRVHYVDSDGHVCTGSSSTPDIVICDTRLLSLNPRGNRAGVMDVLAVRTASKDWDLAANLVGEAIDHNINESNIGIADRLEDHLDEIARCTPTGLLVLANALLGITANQALWGNSRPNVGSEHFLARRLEELTVRAGRRCFHGELLAVCSIPCGFLQGSDIRRLRRTLTHAFLPTTPQDILLSDSSVARLLELPVRLDQRFSILNQVCPQRPVDALRIVRAAYNANSN